MEGGLEDQRCQRFIARVRQTRIDISTLVWVARYE